MINFNIRFAIVIAAADHIVPISDLLHDLGYRWRGGDILRDKRNINWDKNGEDNVLFYTPNLDRCSITKGHLRDLEDNQREIPIYRSGFFYSQVRKGEYEAFAGPEQVRVVAADVPRKAQFNRANNAVNREPVLSLNAARVFYSSENELLKKAAKLHFSEDILCPVSLDRLEAVLKDANTPSTDITIKCLDPSYYKKLLLRAKLMNLCYLLYGKRDQVPLETYLLMANPENNKISIVHTYTMNDPICFDCSEDAEMILNLLTKEEKSLMLSGW